MLSFLAVNTTSPDRVVVIPELEAGKVFLGGGGGGDLFGLSDPCLVKASAAAGFVAVLEGLSTDGLVGFSIRGLGGFSGPFLTGLSEGDVDSGSSVISRNNT